MAGGTWELDVGQDLSSQREEGERVREHLRGAPCRSRGPSCLPPATRVSCPFDLPRPRAGPRESVLMNEVLSVNRIPLEESAQAAAAEYQAQGRQRQPLAVRSPGSPGSRCWAVWFW